MRGAYKSIYGSGIARHSVASKRNRDDDDDSFLLSSDSSQSAVSAFLYPPELKYFDISRDESTVPSNPGITDWIFNPNVGQICSVPLRGDGPQDFTGKAILIKSWNVRGAFFLNPTLNAAEGLRPRWVFIALVLDTQTNGTQCTSDQILQFVYSQNNPGHSAPFQNMDYSNRFLLLRRETWDLSPTTLSIDIGIAPDPNSWQCAGRTQHFEFFIPLDVICNFKSFPAQSEISGVVDNSLHVVCGTNNLSALLTNQPTITCGYVSRIRFECVQ